MKIFPTSSINTHGHYLVGTQWVYRNAVVTMHDEGFNCTCKKNPRVACSHIKNVKLKLYGVFDEYYRVS